MREGGREVEGGMEGERVGVREIEGVNERMSLCEWD